MFSRLGRIRRGEYPLGVTYWLYWLLGNSLMLTALVFLLTVILVGNLRLGAVSPLILLAEFAFGGVFLVVIYPIYAFSTSLGALRSANRYAREGERSWSRHVLARLAQVHAVTGFLVPFLALIAIVMLFLSPAPVHPH